MPAHQGCHKNLLVSKKQNAAFSIYTRLPVYRFYGPFNFKWTLHSTLLKPKWSCKTWMQRHSLNIAASSFHVKPPAGPLLHVCSGGCSGAVPILLCLNCHMHVFMFPELQEKPRDADNRREQKAVYIIHARPCIPLRCRYLHCSPLPFCLLSSLTNSLSSSLPLALPSLSRATKCSSIRMVSVQWDCISFSLWIKHSICPAFSSL